MELTTLWRSSRATSFFDEHVERLEDADAVGDADSVDGTTEDSMGDDVGVFLDANFDAKCGVGAPTVFDIDEGVERSEFRAFEAERLGSEIDVGVDGGAGDPPSWMPVTSTLFTSGSSSLGRERASATKLAFPCT